MIPDEKINEDDYLIAFGNRIKGYREAADMSRDDLAKAIGTTRMQVYRIENGIKKNAPTILILIRIADVLDIKIGELIALK